MSISRTSSIGPAEHLGRRLVPGPTDFLPTSLLLGLFLFGAWTDRSWLVGGGSVLTIVACLAEMRRRRERDGAVAHQSYAWHGRLGWGFAGLFVGIVAVGFWAPLLLDGSLYPESAPTWLQAGLCLVLALALWGGGQAWLRARARHIGSPDGQRLTDPEAPALTDPDDSLDAAIVDLLSRTQTMRALALSEDLMIPTDRLRPRLEELIQQRLISRKAADDSSAQDDQWVHLSFHGEQQLTTA